MAAQLASQEGVFFFEGGGPLGGPQTWAGESEGKGGRAAPSGRPPLIGAASRRQLVRRPVRVAQVAVGRLAVGEALRLGVPLQQRLHLVGDVADQGGARAAVADLDVA